MAHIPPASGECQYSWALRYKALIDRYQHVIRLSLYGHMHSEFHNIARSIENDKPIGISYWTSSVTPYFEVNPSFRVFEVDKETMLPLKVHTYVLYINETEPQWQHSHEISQIYGMKDLSPKSYEELSDRILEDKELAMKYLNQ